MLLSAQVEGESMPKKKTEAAVAGISLPELRQRIDSVDKQIQDLIAERAGLAWAANLAALELHTPMARSVDLESPQMVVFDLDPGEGTRLASCRVAAACRAGVPR